MYNEDLQELSHLAQRVNHHRLEVMALRDELKSLKAELAALKAELYAGLDGVKGEVNNQTGRINALMHWSN
jgi:hypothetical protein